MPPMRSSMTVMSSCRQWRQGPKPRETTIAKRGDRSGDWHSDQQSEPQPQRGQDEGGADMGERARERERRRGDEERRGEERRGEEERSDDCTRQAHDAYRVPWICTRHSILSLLERHAHDMHRRMQTTPTQHHTTPHHMHDSSKREKRKAAATTTHVASAHTAVTS